ncbi:MAG: peptide-N(4)-(N-acetyl-beta-glucosaminyl)asparagine amidase, partial [Candidatus Eremiobacteraeota bacterium]|nr:peptide-N(4)-(N-acetyl-beta-glucosaminyl)asparagine amidase [Candidatus Eremiobacteraeota bacterium]
PYLWFPIPGVQTLNFKPYRVDLTPFAAVLANGGSHTIAFSVDNADNYFQGFATLFAYIDRSSKRVTGGLSRDTLVANPQPTVVKHLSGAAPSTDGTIAVSDARYYTIEGYRNTPNGRVTTTLTSSVDFANLQTYSNESATTGTLAVRQATTDLTTVVTRSPSGVSVRKSYVSYPLFVSLALVLDGTGTGTQVATIDQRYIAEHEQTGPGVFFRDYESNEVTPTDTLDILDDEYITGNADQKSAQTYVAEDSLGHCYAQRIEAANNAVKSVTNGHCNFSEVGKP